MKEIAAALLTLLGNPVQPEFHLPLVHGDWRLAEHAFLRFGEHVVIFVATRQTEMRLGVVALREKYLPEGFVGERSPLPGGGTLLEGSCERKNAAALRRHCPLCAPAAPDRDEELTVATDFSGDSGKMRLYIGGEADLCALRDRLTFAAFVDGMRKKYALGGNVKDASGAARLLDCGATYVEFLPLAEATDALPAEYRDRRFVLTDDHAVKIADVAFPAETLREAEKIAKLASAHHAAWRMVWKKELSAAEHLVLARELYRKNAVPQQLIVAAPVGKSEDHAAIAARYGKYGFQTVS